MPAVADINPYAVVRGNPEETLTPRQLELLALYASGYQLAEIATLKFLSYGSVRNTLSLARDRVGARSLTHLCVICLDAGLIAKNGASSYMPVQIDGVIGE